MEKVKAELVDVSNKEGKINLTFLGDNQIYEVVWNLKAYDPTLNDWVESGEKEEQFEGWSKQYFGVSTDKLEKKLGTKCDVFVYDTFASLWESAMKFKKEDFKQTYQTKIEDVTLTDNEIQIWYYWKDGNKYMTRKTFTQKMGDNFYLNPIKKRKQIKSFEEQYGVSIEDKDKLIGKSILVEVKRAFGKYYYGDITVL